MSFGSRFSTSLFGFRLTAISPLLNSRQPKTKMVSGSPGSPSLAQVARDSKDANHVERSPTTNPPTDPPDSALSQRVVLSVSLRKSTLVRRRQLLNLAGLRWGSAVFLVAATRQERTAVRPREHIRVWASKCEGRQFRQSGISKVSLDDPKPSQIDLQRVRDGYLDDSRRKDT